MKYSFEINMKSPSTCDNMSDIMLSSPGSSDGSDDDKPVSNKLAQQHKSGIIRTTRKRAAGCSGENSSAKSSGNNKAAVPAKDKEPHLVQRRNARERKRVQLVNEGFIRLRRKIPTEPRNKKLSKLKTLGSAINYILHLQETLQKAQHRQQRLGELENLGMNIPLQHTPPQQPYEWVPHPEPVMCNGFEYVENHGGGYYY